MPPETLWGNVPYTMQSTTSCLPEAVACGLVELDQGGGSTQNGAYTLNGILPQAISRKIAKNCQRSSSLHYGITYTASGCSRSQCITKIIRDEWHGTVQARISG
jgi:hypothetical protein